MVAHAGHRRNNAEPERPNDVCALSNLGGALASVGKDDLAVTVFQQAVAVDPSNMLARRNLVRELLNTNRCQNALTPTSPWSVPRSRLP